MTQQELSQAKDPDLSASLVAIKRAAVEARKIAIQTGTDIVIVQDNQIQRISAATLRQSMPPESDKQGTSVR